MTFRQFSIAIFLLIFISSCARVPEHELAEKMVSSQTEKVALEALDSPSFVAGDWPRDNWWEEFDDPGLTELIEFALKVSPTLLKAEERLKAAAQVALEKKAKLYPEIDLIADDNWQHWSANGLYRAFAPTFPPVVNQIDIALSFFYEFDFWGKNRDLFKAALGKAAAMAAEKKQAELILTTSIAYNYLEGQYLVRKIDLLKKLGKNENAVFSLTERREKEALSTEMDKLTASTLALDVKNEIFQTEQSLQQTLHKLKALTGLGQDASLVLNWKPLKETKIPIPENLSLNLLSRRPDLKAQLMRLEAAAKEIDAAKTDFYPNVNLSAFAGFETLKGFPLFPLENFNGSLSPALTLPIFTAGRLRAQLYEKVAVFNEAVQSYNELILQAAQEVANHVSDISWLWKQREIKKETLENSQRTVRLTADRFKNAIDTKISLLNAENNYIQSALVLLQIDYAKELAKIQLIQSLGGGYCCD